MVPDARPRYGNDGNASFPDRDPRHAASRSRGLGDLRPHRRHRVLRRCGRRARPVHGDRLEGDQAAGAAHRRAAAAPHLASARPDRDRAGAGGARRPDAGGGRGGGGGGTRHLGGAARPRAPGGADVVRVASRGPGAARVHAGLSRGLDRPAARRPGRRPGRRRHRRGAAYRGTAGLQSGRAPAVPGRALAARRTRLLRTSRHAAAAARPQGSCLPVLQLPRDRRELAVLRRRRPRGGGHRQGAAQRHQRRGAVRGTGSRARPGAAARVRRGSPCCSISSPDASPRVRHPGRRLSRRGLPDRRDLSLRHRPAAPGIGSGPGRAPVALRSRGSDAPDARRRGRPPIDPASHPARVPAPDRTPR